VKGASRGDNGGYWFGWSWTHFFSCGVSWSRPRLKLAIDQSAEKTLGNLVSRQAYGVGYDIGSRKACQSPLTDPESFTLWGRMTGNETRMVIAYLCLIPSVCRSRGSRHYGLSLFLSSSFAFRSPAWTGARLGSDRPCSSPLATS